jgi:ethanolamine utilization protein EutA
LTATVAARLPVVVILDCDVARLVGENLSRSMNGYRDIICIDGVHLHDFDYVDISKEHVHTQTVTVVIKSLVFSG